MRLFTIGDLHLSFGVPEKPMDIFGGWKDYQTLLEQSWREKITEEDTVVLAGDFSWGMNLQQAEADFAFVQKLPGKKIFLKGNHDYWWTSLKKMEDFFTAHGFDSLHILHNNHYAFGQYGICGTRGWVSMQGEAADAKILAREVQRLQVSIQSAVSAGLEPIVFLHYPPIYGSSMNYDILEVLHQYQIKQCYYGHVHGKGHCNAFQGRYEETEMHLISSDYLQFVPELVMRFS
ncbi:metallophosphoesterase [Ruminococcus sp.]|uniref:metallophosphoesterase n=1 Tax=Ruminococcus sp. TaxID=41978 RepID=UPI0025E713CC|nr:metallophosphoesterase [Ruminococcus sp.]